MPKYDLLDLIDPDEGRELVQQAFYAEGEPPCENCGKPCFEGRVHVPGFDFLGCQDCAEKARIVTFAEENCPTLYTAVMRSRSVQQVAKTMREHAATCPNCNPKVKAAGEVVEMPSRRQEREAA